MILSLITILIPALKDDAGAFSFTFALGVLLFVFITWIYFADLLGAFY